MPRVSIRDIGSFLCAILFVHMWLQDLMNALSQLLFRYFLNINSYKQIYTAGYKINLICKIVTF